MEIIIIKKLKLFLLFLFMPTFLLAQDKTIYDFIGGKISNATAAYGKPTHHDKSIPEMECIFYKTKTNRIVFVGNKNGIFQAEQCTTITEEGSAKKVFDQIISRSISDGFIADTLSSDMVNLIRSGTDMSVSFFNNTYAKQFEINLKAKKVAE